MLHRDTILQAPDNSTPTRDGISAQIELARSLFSRYGEELLTDETMSEMLIRLDKEIGATQDEMAATGVSAECADCAAHGEGTCCSERTGHKCDITLLLINLLLGRPLPEESQSGNQCFFLSERGCVLRARPIICVNFVCQRLRERIPFNTLVHLQQTAGREMDLLFGIEEYVKLRVYY